MSTETETLLAESLEELVAGQPFSPDVDRIERRGRHLRRRANAVRAVAGAGVATAVVAAAVLGPGGGATFSTKPPTTAAAGTGGAAVLMRLASASATLPTLQGRYVVLPETDSNSRATGQVERTTVIDTATGASTTYQLADGNPLPAGTVHIGYTGPQPVLTEGPDPSSTGAWFSALPTDPTALRAELLSIAKQQGAAAGKELPSSLEPAMTDDDYVYEEANALLWSPLVQPALRSALYQVLAQTPGVSVDSKATDPAGRPAIAMSRSGNPVAVIAGQVVHVTPDNPATDITYEDPSTGAVLAQVWSEAGDTMTAVYQPATGSATIPPDPYSAG